MVATIPTGSIQAMIGDLQRRRDQARDERHAGSNLSGITRR